MERKSEFVKQLGKLVRDIQAIKVDENTTSKALVKKFYAVMEKHGIAQGDWTKGGGRIVCSPEWVICWYFFTDNIRNHYSVWELLNTPPKKLLAYGNKPKKTQQ